MTNAKMGGCKARVGNCLHRLPYVVAVRKLNKTSYLRELLYWLTSIAGRAVGFICWLSKRELEKICQGL